MNKKIVIAEAVFSFFHFIPAILFVGFGLVLNWIFLIGGSGFGKIGDSSMFADGIKFVSLISFIPIIFVFILFILSIISLVRFLKSKSNMGLELIVCIGYSLIDIFLIIFCFNFSLFLVIFSFISLVVYLLGVYYCIRGE